MFKCWLKESWLALYDRLRALGVRAHVLGQPQTSTQVKELVESGLPFLPTPTIKDALDVVSSARAMVSVDTGLMHMALQQLVPCAAIWINNPGSLNYMRTVKHCFPVVSPRCSSACVSEELDKNLNLVTEFKEWQGYDSWMCHAQSKDRCMNNVSIDSVWRQTESALSLAQQTIACRM